MIDTGQQQQYLFVTGTNILLVDVEGMVTLPSGLQYKILEAGKGEKPSKTDTVTVDYEGRLLNGKIFDSINIKKNGF